MAITLSDQDKTTLRVAAYGAVTLLSAAGAAGGSPVMADIIGKITKALDA